VTYRKAARFLAASAFELALCAIIVVACVVATPFILALQLPDLRRGGL
jgi:hypothetical protein